MGNKRLSIIVPGYNNPSGWWCRCVESVLANIGEQDEVICVDDGSIVRPECLEGIAAGDSRVRIIYRDTNGGLSSARNTALEVAKGEYVTFVDSDDQVLPDTYEKALSCMERLHYDIAMYGVRSHWVNERLVQDDEPEYREIGLMTPQDVDREYQRGILNYAWNKVYRRSFLNEHKLKFDPDGMPCEDIIFVLQCIICGAKWVTINHIGIIYYRTHATLLSRYQKSYLKGTRQAGKIWTAYKEAFPEACDILRHNGNVDEMSLARGEWNNIWKEGAPFSLRQRWLYLKQHAEITNRPLIAFFLSKLVYSFLRKYFYVRPVQKWHIKRVYPRAKPI